jgi:GT2 family glycosyltransferase
MVKIAYICPTYNEGALHAYTMQALNSFFKTTAGGVAIVVDDNSEDFEKYRHELASTPLFAGQEVKIHHFGKWGGLTRSWNKGIALASKLGCDYVAPSNNDIIFTPRWYEGLLHALENGYALVGPVSNCPGVTAKGNAEVWQYKTDYRVTDDLNYLNGVAEYLRTQYTGQVVDTGVNGFFQLGKVKSFEAGRYDADHYYCPKNDFSSKGRRNPTPFMTLNEDELQGRWSKKGWKAAVVPSSFIFHYRAVTRGARYKKGKWFRMAAGG